VAQKAYQAALRGEWENATYFWGQTQFAVLDKTNFVSFYNIHKFHHKGDYEDNPELQLMLNAGGSNNNITYSFIVNCQSAVVHK